MASTGVGCMHTARQDHDPYGLLDQPEAIAPEPRAPEPRTLDIEQLRQERDANWFRYAEIQRQYGRALVALQNADGMGDPGPTEQMRRDMQAARDRYIRSEHAFNEAWARQQQRAHTRTTTRMDMLPDTRVHNPQVGTRFFVSNQSNQAYETQARASPAPPKRRNWIL